MGVVKVDRDISGTGLLVSLEFVKDLGIILTRLIGKTEAILRVAVTVATLEALVGIRWVLFGLDRRSGIKFFIF